MPSGPTGGLHFHEHVDKHAVIGMEQAMDELAGRASAPGGGEQQPAEQGGELAAKFRMPRWFGATPGPRNVPSHRAGIAGDADMLNVAVTALTEAEPLARLLPPGCRLRGDPTITVTASFLSNLGWLAGRGYNIVAASIPATFTGQEDSIDGEFVAAMWESLADPIITGREELGFAKLFADVEGPGDLAGRYRARASWDGFSFLELDAWNVTEGPGTNPAAPDPGAGSLHYKFIPRTGAQGEADVEYMVLAPNQPPPGGASRRTSVRLLHGEGHFGFCRARWEQMPTQYHIVSALAALPLLEFRGAAITDISTRGAAGGPLDAIRRLR